MNKQVLNSSGPMLPNTEHYGNHSAAHRVRWKLTSGMNKNEYVGHNPEIYVFMNSWSALLSLQRYPGPTSNLIPCARFAPLRLPKCEWMMAYSLKE